MNIPQFPLRNHPVAKVRIQLHIRGMLRMQANPHSCRMRCGDGMHRIEAQVDLNASDEPAAGVNRTLANRIFEHIGELNRQGTSFLIVEHEIELVMRWCVSSAT